MATEIKLPLRPKNIADFKIDKRAMDCLTYVGLTGVKNSTAFALFYPEFTDIEGVKRSVNVVLTDDGQRYCMQFFRHEDNARYLASYKATLKAFLGDSRGIDRRNGEITEERKESALKSLLNKAITLVEGGEDIDPDTLKTISEVFKRLGMLKDEVVAEELPRRYLPEKCSTCAYKQFIDQQVELGNIEQTNE